MKNPESQRETVTVFCNDWGYLFGMRAHIKTANIEAPQEFNLLPPRRYVFGKLLVVACAAALIAWAVAEIFQFPLHVPSAIVVAGALLFTSVVLHWRRRRKHKVMDELVLRTYDALGAKRIDRKLVRCEHWSRGIVPRPSRILFHHNPVTWDGRALGENRANLVIGLGLKPILQKLFPGMKISITPGPQPFTLVAELSDEESEGDIPPEDDAGTRATLVASELFKEPAEIQTEVDEEGTEFIKVKHNQGIEFALAARRTRIERIFNTRVPGQWRAHWDTINDEIVFKQRKDLPTMVKIDVGGITPIMTHAQYTDFQILIGVAENNVPVFWRPYIQSHALVVGPTGSGKTVLLHNIAIACSHAGLRVWVIDGKRIEFLGFRWWPNIEFIAAKVPHQIKLIADAKRLMDQRYDLIEDGKASLDDFEPIIIIIDEVASMVKRIESWWMDQGWKGKPPVKEWLSELGRLARTAKIHMIIGLQRPDVQFLEGEMRSNFGARYSVGRLDPQGAIMMWENAAVGTTVPRSKKGRGFATTLDGDVVETQFIYAPNPYIPAPGYDPEFVGSVRPAEERWGVKHIEDIEEIQIDIDGKDVRSSLDDFLEARVIEGPHPNWARITESPRTGDIPVDEEMAAAADIYEEIVIDEVIDEDSSPDTDDEFEGFSSQILSLTPDHLEAGDLIEVDPFTSLWGVVEDVTTDEVGAQIDYRAMTTGEPEMLDTDRSEKIRTRKPIDAI